MSLGCLHILVKYSKGRGGRWKTDHGKKRLSVMEDVPTTEEETLINIPNVLDELNKSIRLYC